MRHHYFLIGFLQREWFLVLSIVSYILTSLYMGHFSTPTPQELEILFVLYAILVVIEGLRLSGIISKASEYIEKGKFVSIKLIIGTFILSMFVTNDIALIILVPITLTLNLKNSDMVIIFEALAANAGSALTPFGNPQNLYIYWFYKLKPLEFFTAILPFSLTFLALLIAFSFIFAKNTENDYSEQRRASKKPEPSSAWSETKKISSFYAGMFIIVLLTVFHIFPAFITLPVIALCSLVDLKTLKIDYPLLLSLLFLCGTTDNIKAMLAARIEHSGHIFILSALMSQFISNVPTAMLFAKFSTNWKAILWGTNTGGFGSIIGSLANLIAYRFYIANQNNTTGNIPLFTAKFIVIGYSAFFIAIGLYFLLLKF